MYGTGIIKPFNNKKSLAGRLLCSCYSNAVPDGMGNGSPEAHKSLIQQYKSARERLLIQ